MIAKEREYEKIQQKLYDEFKLLDKNQNGMISIDEIVDFLSSKKPNVSLNPFISSFKEITGHFILKTYIYSLATTRSNKYRTGKYDF